MKNEKTDNKKTDFDDFLFINGQETNIPACSGGYFDVSGTPRCCPERAVLRDDGHQWCARCAKKRGVPDPIPLEACVTDTIERFAGPDRFLSNFYLAEIMWEEKTYASSEHLYQAMKAGTEEEREWVRTAPTAKEAKFRGQRVRATADWGERRIDAMRSALEAKFGQHPDLATKLDETGDTRLVEGNTWGDTFWGVDSETGRGESHLGELLMELRAARRGQEEQDAV